MLSISISSAYFNSFIFYPILLYHFKEITDSINARILLRSALEFDTVATKLKNLRGRSQTTFTRQGRLVVQKCPLFVNVLTIENVNAGG